MLIGGILVGLRAARTSPPPAELLKSIRFGYIVAGGTLTLVTGLYQLLWLGPHYYFSQGWFHGKLTAAILLFGIAGYVFVKLSKVEKSGVPLLRKDTVLLHSAVGILFLLAVLLTVLGRQSLI